MLWKLMEYRRRRLSEESGAIRKDWGGRIRIALAFPNRYAVGMSNLGFQSVYGALNGLDNIVCERVFYPEPEELEALKRYPGKLLSMESQRPVSDFDLFAFSIPFENDYSNAVEMLVMAGIPPHSKDRSPACPLVAAGGVAVFLNPEPISAFIDFFFVGESEALLPDFIRSWETLRTEGANRVETLMSLAGTVAGIYVPSLYQAKYRDDGALDSIEPLPGLDIPRRVVYRRADFRLENPCRTVIHTPNTEFSDVTLLEIGRGCGRGCRFCAAGYVYRPVRYMKAEKLIESIGTVSPERTRIGLVSAAVSDHPEISSLCRSLLDAKAVLSFSSIRANGMVDEMLSALETNRRQAIAIAPEAGSERLRRVINKNLSMDEIDAGVERLVESGIMNLKLYFMIGLPTETPDDVEAVIDAAKRIKHRVLKVSRGRKRLGTIVLSVNSFVPKPFTPFQWVPFAGVKELKERARKIQKALAKVPNVRVHFDLPKWAYVQALLSRGDRRAGLFLEKTALEGNSWSRAMRGVPFNPDFWVMRERGRDEVFPWEIIDHGVRRSYLWEEYQRALEEKSTPMCRPDENCRRCGACGP